MAGLKGQQSYLSIRYLMAVMLIMAGIISAYVFVSAHRMQNYLRQIMEQEGLVLAEALEISSRNAILGNRMLEDMIAQRLLDNARLVDLLLAQNPSTLAHLDKIAKENQLHRLEVRGAEGALIADNTRPPMGPGGMMERMMGRMTEQMPGMMHPPDPPETGERMREHMRQMFFWPIIQGRTEEVVQGLGERKFWRGSNYGVALKRQYGPGLIVILADARYILNFRQEIGLERLARDLRDRPGLEYIALQDENSVFLAHSDASLVGKKGQPLLLNSGQQRLVRVLPGADGNQVLEVARPFSLQGLPLGTIRIGLSLEPLAQVRKKSVTAIVMIGAAFLIVGLIGMAIIFLNQRRHIDAVRALEAQVRRSERLASLGNLAAGVAHEVRNPLNALAMASQRLQKEFIPQQGKEEYERFIALMRGEIARIDGIVERFLSLARPAKPVLQPLDISVLIREVAALLKVEAEQKGIELKLDTREEPCRLKADVQQLKQATMNILLNAIQATPAGGSVSFSCQRKGQQVRISIADTGPGIAGELKERVFDPYYTTREGGMGLGLYIAQSILQEHGGRIEVESTLGEGAVFTLVLPQQER
ncbi:MAG: ATP-binding protein [Thermodesulfobacteriota bacterium]